MRKNLSIIIVNFKSDGLVAKLRASIPKKQDWEILVIDNSANNRGYGKACNLGARKARGKKLLFLNPDTVIKKGAIEKMIEYLDKNKRVGIVGPQLVDEEGRAYASFAGRPTMMEAVFAFSVLDRIFPNNRYSRNYWYRGVSLKKTRQVGSVSGAAMMIRRDDFIKIGGFDERYFMYWEDADICGRMMEAGKRVVYLPEAKVEHSRAGSTYKTGEAKRYFVDSRWLYLKIYLGILKGSLAGVFIIATEHWRFLAVMLVAAGLRFWKLPELMPLIGDQGRDMLAAWEALRRGQLPLLGIPSSVPRFSQGPVYIWLLMGLFGIFGPDPVVAAMAAAAMGLVSVGLVYILVERYYGKMAAGVAALILATSPLAVAQSRMAYHTNPIPLATLLLLWLLVKPIKSKWDVWWLGLAFGLVFQFELAAAPLVLLGVYKIVKQKKRECGVWVMYMAGVMTAMLPQIIYDIKNNFAQLGMFGVWVGYRIFGFLGMGDEHRLSGDKLSGYLASLLEYGSKFFYPLSTSYLIFPVVVIGLGILLVKSRRGTKEDNLLVYSLLWTVLLLSAYLVHGSPSEAYYPVLFVPVVVVMGVVMSKLRWGWRRLAIIMVILAGLVNTHYMWSRDMLMNTPRSRAAGLVEGYGLTLRAQEQIISIIKRFDEQGEYRFEAMGPGSEHESFVDNYRFLARRGGLAVVKEGGRTVYFLFGRAREFNFLNSLRYDLDGVTLVIQL